ncbi:hypothetical protein CCP4SC76_2490009 [Gammaproteobacteria bacterium]
MNQSNDSISFADYVRHGWPIMNGISANATRPDLIDRVIHVDLPAITDRRLDAEINAAFEADRPAIFTGLLTLLSHTQARLPEVFIPPKNLPRMADFAHLGEAMMRVLGHPEGEFLRVYTENRKESMLRALDGSGVAAAILGMIEAGREINGETLKAAFTTLLLYKPANAETPFPHTPRGLGDQLRRFKPAMSLVGIEIIEHGRGMHGFTVTVKKHVQEAKTGPQTRQTGWEATL